jgi:hypothetical protein
MRALALERASAQHHDGKTTPLSPEQRTLAHINDVLLSAGAAVTLGIYSHATTDAEAAAAVPAGSLLSNALKGFGADAGVTDRVWDMSEVAAPIAAHEAPLQKRAPYKKAGRERSIGLRPGCRYGHAGNARLRRA